MIRVGRPKLARGPSRQAPKEALPGSWKCSFEKPCTRTATTWRKLTGWCDRHVPDAPLAANCSHRHTVTAFGVTTCSWCLGNVLEES